MAKDQGSQIKPKVTFDMLFDKYTKQKAVPNDRPLKKRMRSSPRQERPLSPPRAAVRHRGESSSMARPAATSWTPPDAKLSPMWGIIMV